MSKSKRYKTVIEIEHCGFTDVIRFLSNLDMQTISTEQKKRLGAFNFSISNVRLDQDVEVVQNNFENAKESIINGKLYMVYQSKINSDE